MRFLIILACISASATAHAQKFPSPTVNNLTITGSSSTGEIGGMTATPTNSTIPRTLGNRASDFLNVRDLGAKCDGTTDDTAAFQSAMTKAAAATYGAVEIYVPGGRCVLTAKLTASMSGYTSFRIRGAGSDVSELVWTSATDGIGITLSGSQAWLRSGGSPGNKIIVSDISLVRSNSAAGNTAINVDGTSTTGAGILGVEVRNVTIRGDVTGPNWAIGARYNATQQTDTTNLYFHGPNGSKAGIAVQIDGGSNYSVDHRISNLRAASVDKAVLIGLNVQGVYLVNPIIVGSNYGVYWDATTSTTRADLLQITGGHIGSAITAGVYANNVDTVQVSGTYMIAGSGSWSGVSASNGYRLTVDGSTTLLGTNGATQRGIYANNMAGGTIAGVVFSTFGVTGSFPVVLAGTTTGMTVVGNSATTVNAFGSDASGTNTWALNYGAAAWGVTQSVYKDVSGNLHFAGTNLALDSQVLAASGATVSGGALNVTGSANNLGIAGSVASSPVTMTAFGSDTNVGIQLTPKGAGSITMTGLLMAASGATVSGGALNVTGSANNLAITGTGTGVGPNLLAFGADTNIDLQLIPKGTGNVTTPNSLQSALLKLTTNYTVAGLPTCNSGSSGSVAYVTDATAPTYNATLSGGGAVRTLGLCNGTNWTAH